MKNLSIIQSWNYLKGNPEEFSLQSRIYHSVCIATILVIAYNVPFSLFVGLYYMTFLSGILLILQFFFYYLSRFKNMLHTSMIIYSVIINIFFALDYYFSSGIQGATLYSFTIAYFLIIAIAQKKHYWYWTTGNITLVLSLIVYEYYHPEIIHYRYTNRQSQFIDISSTYIITILLIFACLTYIIGNYNQEKEATALKNQELKKMNEENNKLISVISHDFGAPLRNIQAYFKILSRVEVDTERRKELEEELKRTTDETVLLLDNLLSWTRKQMNGPDYPLVSLQLKDCLREVLEQSEPNASSKRIELINSLNPDIYVMANRELLQIMVRNLLNNAIKFTEEGGEVEINAHEEDAFCILEVKDNGIGINEKLKSMIFSLNVQSRFGTANEKGIGLGLVICKDFAETQHIDISFESESGVGTTFFLKIPLG